MEGAAGTAQAPMAQQELDPPEIDACFQSVRSEGMAERFDIMLHLIDKH
jgi:hypothetical protein